MKRIALAAAVLAGCAGLPGQDVSCTTENAFLMGSRARAYFGTCPKETEAAFLAALERGRTFISTPSVLPYIERMRETEKQLLASSGAERDRLRTRLTDLEWWAVHLLTAPGSYGEGT